MRLRNIKAIPHPSGNRIDLSWEYDDPAQTPTVRVVRRADRYPTSPDDGIPVAPVLNSLDEQLPYAVDQDLKSETVYYYGLFPDHSADPHNRVAAMATGPYNMAGQIYDLLPAIYRRYEEADGPRGPLRRFLELPGGQLDQIYSFARALLDLHDLDRVDGRLLPLLADWIGWRTDFHGDLQAQRNELRHAPSIQETVATVPTIEAAVKRLIGWECRVKEFANNVFRSNQPERLNLWAMQRTKGAWTVPTLPLSLDFAYEGRPAAVIHTEANGTTRRWLFYHTPRSCGVRSSAAGSVPPQGSWTICYKSAVSFQAEADQWVVSSEWSPSQPVPDQDEGAMNRHPTAVWLDGTLWVFWDAYDEDTRGWRIECRSYRDGQWKQHGDDQPAQWAGQDRRSPCAVVHANALWLFWMERTMERTEDGWRLRFSRRGDGQVWSKAVDVPPADDENKKPVDPKVESDLFALALPDQERLMLFWARREPVKDQPGQTRWRIVYLVTQGDDPGVPAGWSPIHVFHALPEPPQDADEREPAAVIVDGKIELFWSSTRDGSWSLWRAELDAGSAEPVSSPVQLTFGPYNERTPLPLADGADTLLVYRSSASVPYTSPTYSATRTLDTRYAGCTSVDTRNAARKGLRKLFDDFETYTYDTGPRGTPNNETWYARDAVGIYLRPETEDIQEIERHQKLIEQFLPQFLPIQVRIVFIIEPWQVVEPIYDYSSADGRLIGEEIASEWRGITEQYEGVDDGYYQAEVKEWTWVRAWPHRVSPLGIKATDVTNNLLYRIWYKDVKAEE